MTKFYDVGPYFRKVTLNESYLDHCYLNTEFIKQDLNEEECLEKSYNEIANGSCFKDALGNGTDWVYDPAESIIAFLGATLQSIAGIVLNLLVVIALLRTPNLRKEYMTPFILSLAATDLIYSAFTLPIIAARYFEG